MYREKKINRKPESILGDKAYPLVSLCIPAFRQPAALLRCLDSIQSQTFTDFEIIITDDTPDDSVKSVADRHPLSGKIRYFHNHPQKGTPENWNEGMRRAKGEYLIVLHHDDWFYNQDTLRELITSAIHHSADFVFGKSQSMNDKMEITFVNNPETLQINKLSKDVRYLFFNNWIGAPSAVLFKKDAIYYDPELKWLVDIDFYIRYLKKHRFHYNPNAVIAIGISNEQVTRNCLGNIKIELKENIQMFKRLRFKLGFLILNFKRFYELFIRLELNPKDLRKHNPPFLIDFFYFIASAIKRMKKHIKYREKNTG